jgi:hypothetical protein
MLPTGLNAVEPGLLMAGGRFMPLSDSVPGRLHCTALIACSGRACLNECVGTSVMDL